MKKKIPTKAKLISAGGLYRFIPMEELHSVINLPVMRRITLTDPEIDYSETWHFTLVFRFVRLLKSYAEYEQIDMIKVKLPTQPT